MSENLFSASWYRVAQLRPRLRRHARIQRHVYRGQPWYVLEDVLNQRVHRFTPATHSVIGLMDGQRSVNELWRIATESLGDDGPTQDEMIRLLAQLHAADVLQCDVPPDTAELLERYEKHESQLLKSKLLSPFSIRIPLVDPDRFLRRLVPWARPLAGRMGAALWLAVVLPAIFLAGEHWSELTKGVLDRVFTPQSLILLWLVFPVIKALHELGHGILTRLYGGEVHDMGLTLLVFTPVPYVDASSASAFPERGRRALVASGGMIVEIFVAALAFYLWLAVEPGVLRSIAFNVMLVAGVTTLTFNANPLLRFDGYYILSDVVEIPNLRQRSNGYIAYLVERWAFGSREALPPEASRTERGWLVAFAVASFLYRVFVFSVIVLLLLRISIVLGTILAVVAMVGMLAMPVGKGLKFLFRDPQIAHVRSRAIAVAGGAVAVTLLLVAVVPLPHHTQSEGVVWLPDEAFVRAGTDGFVERVDATPGARVHKGDVLFTLRDPELEAGARVLEAQLRELQVKEQQALLEDRVKAAMFDEEIGHYQQRLARTRERLAALVVRSGADGVFVVPAAQDLPDRFVDQGEVMAHVVQPDLLKVRAIVHQEDVELVRDRLQDVQVRRVEAMDEIVPAHLVRLVPSATPELPSPVLGAQGGGELAMDPRDQRGVSAVSPFFQAELELSTAVRAPSVGSHVYVRFDYGFEPLVVRGYRALRQLFLARLDV